jgi:hypothetical protein
VERRADEEMRILLERAAEVGSFKALVRFGDMTPHDLSRHEGREEFRADLQHAHTLRVGCDTIKREGWRMFGRAFWYVSVALIAGVLVYTFGFDPNKFKIPG